MTKKRGFGSMDIEKMRRIASMGGKAAHAKGTAHKFTKEEASKAGIKGGSAPHANRPHKNEALPSTDTLVVD
jgi:general stress protein YciG